MSRKSCLTLLIAVVIITSAAIAEMCSKDVYATRSDRLPIQVMLEGA